MKLFGMGWITQADGEDFYLWSEKFPKQEFLKLDSSKQKSSGQNIKGTEPKNFQEKKILDLASQCTLDGMQEGDLPIIIEAAHIEEKKNNIKAAVIYYDAVISLIQSVSKKRVLSDSLRRTFIQAVERRAAFSYFFPRFKKLSNWISAAQDMAIELDDPNIKASMEFLLAQFCWISNNVKEAMVHWETGWRLAESLNDSELQNRFLKLKVNYHISEGNLIQAIRQHELFIGNIEPSYNDFSVFILAGLAMTYTEVGLPQRGLGFIYSIRNQCSKNNNELLLGFSLLFEGLILLEIRKLKESRKCLETVLEISEAEKNIPLSFLSKVGLICIECLENNYTTATKIFKTVCDAPKSSWYYLVNYSALFGDFYKLYGRDPALSGEIFRDFLIGVDKEKVFPTISHMIQHLLITAEDNDMTVEEKILKLVELERTIGAHGPTFESSKILTDIALLYSKIEDRITAKKYAMEAWKFYKNIARDAFHKDLHDLLEDNELSIDVNLSELIIEMGNALTKQYNIKGLLTSIIMSISRLTGAERSAIFIKNEESEELKMVASRNLVEEDILHPDFQPSFDAVQETVISKKEKIFDLDIPGYIHDKRKALITPLMLQDQVIGVLYQDSRLFSFDIGSSGSKNISALASQIALAIDQARAHDEIAKLNKKLIQENLYYINEKEEFRPFRDVIGTSKAIMEVQKLILRVAPTQSTVLIHGETGVGKELVARAIHRESSRKDGPFIRVNCAALADGLIDSELFGHERGAFTGAIKTRAGRFELAHQGTIFLDEVSELPLSTQSRLLRILQEKEFQRVGGTEVLHSDFRLITATNKELEKEIEKGRFREDLYYRLNVYPIRVPPLRERGEDIPLLAVHFLKLFSTACNKPYTGFTTAEMEKLKSYSWPGNIRELSNFVERYAISGDSKIQISELIHHYSKNGSAIVSEKTFNLRDMEKETIIAALEKSKGKIGGKDGAASLLGVERTTLMHRLKKLGIKTRQYHEHKS